MRDSGVTELHTFDPIDLPSDISGELKLYVTAPPDVIFTLTLAECALKGILAVYELPPLTNAGIRPIVPVDSSSYVSSIDISMISGAVRVTRTGYTPSSEEYTYTTVDDATDAEREIVLNWGLVPVESSVDVTCDDVPQRVDALT